MESEYKVMMSFCLALLSLKMYDNGLRNNPWRIYCTGGSDLSRYGG